MCSSVFQGIAPLTALIQQWPLYFTTFLPNVLIIVAAVQIWEEGGWSGYAVPNLQKRFGALRATFILGPLWKLWHLPAFFVPGQLSYKPDLAQEDMESIRSNEVLAAKV